jgi:outer membrane lipoprotein-sorting protein
MKSKYLLSVVAAIGAAVCFIMFSSASARAQDDPITEVLNRMDKHYKGLSSLRSDVTMVKYNSQLGKGDTYTGNTSYLPKTAKRKMYIRVDWVTPNQESMIVIGDDYKLYRPNIKQAIVGNTSTARDTGKFGGALTFLSMSKEQLKANYTVRYAGVEQLADGTATWHVALTPKAETSYKSADLWVDKDGMPRQALVTEGNDDSTTVLLKNIQKNVVIKTDVFNLALPEGTKIVKG